MRRILLLAILGGIGVLVLVLNSATTLATAPSGFGATFTYRATVQP
jgi:hypothetical protein